MTHTSYQCPDCKKWVVVEQEPPAIAHYCEDCSERMVKDGGE